MLGFFFFFLDSFSLDPRSLGYSRSELRHKVTPWMAETLSLKCTKVHFNKEKSNRNTI